MEFEPATLAWKGRGKDAVLGAPSVIHGRDGGGKLVLITTTSEVVEYCTAARKCLNHWSFRPGSSAALRLGAVRNPTSLVYFGVRGAKKREAATASEMLVAWRQTDLDVAKWRHSPMTASSTAPIVGLFVHPQLPEEVVVVHENGHFACYDDALERVFDSVGGPVISSLGDDDATVAENADGGRRVIWAGLSSSHRNPTKGALLLSMLVQTKTSSTYELVVHRIHTRKDRHEARIGTSLVVRHVLQTPTPVVSCVFHAETLSYSIISTGGDWQMLAFTQDLHNGTMQHVATKKVTALSVDLAEAESSTPTQKKRKLSNADRNGARPSTVGGQFVAGCVGPFSYAVLASAAAPQQLVGWDSKFGVQVASTVVKSDKDIGETSPFPTSFGAIRSLSSSLHGEVVVAAYEHAVFLLTVKNKHSTLASVLGVYKGKTAEGTRPPVLPNTNVNWEHVAEKKVELAQWEQQVCSEDAEEQQLIADLINPSTTLTAPQFQKKFDAAIERAGSVEALSYRFIMAVTHRCLEAAEQKIGLWAPLRALIASKRLAARAVPSLLPTLMRHNQFGLLELALVHVTDIDERSIVRLLRYFIRKNDHDDLKESVGGQQDNKQTSTGKRKKSGSDEATTDAIEPCERFLVALLSLPTNSVFLHHAIRELELRDVLFLLAICKKYFLALAVGTNAEPLETASTAKAKKSTPTKSQPSSSSLEKIVRHESSLFFTPLPTALQSCAWICALLDGHVAQLVLTASKNPTTAKSLEQLEGLVQRQLEACDRYEDVQSVLGNFLSGVKLPQVHGIPDYSIEELVM